MRSWLTPDLVLLGGISTFCCLFSLNADEETLQQPTPPPPPWFTGPLIAPSGTAVPLGHFSVEPYLTVGTVRNFYNSKWKSVSSSHLNTVNFQLPIYIGLAKAVDIQISPQLVSNFSKNHSSTEFGDLPITLDFQLIRINKFKWFPGVKLAITEIFPTGEYENSNPVQRNTGSSGSNQNSGLGAYATAPALVFYKIYHLYKRHFLSLTASVEYSYSTPVRVNGMSVYQGNPETKGKVYPGNALTAILSFEYSLTQNWVLALDNVYTHQDKDRFKGTMGTGTPIGKFSSEQLSFAPAIEYNINENFGLIAGVWLTATGRNTPEFCNGIFSFNYSY